eukprot:GILJ01010254.1.p1 GENE.GILJ01010254.1~~GILJ01010254.1.p1  ORF type:complete len:828 (-),score=154.47 GILJ01010254.1:150-2387(-)
MDGFNLTLQNFLYEKSHIEGQIQSCKDFSMKEMDKITLIDEVQFLQQAPPELAQAELRSSDPHKFFLNRLSFELEERKRLQAHLASLQARKQELAGVVSSKTRFLESLQGQLQALENVTKPLQTFMDIDMSRQQERRELAKLLPAPLYNIFAKASTLKQSKLDDDITVEIEGSTTDAQAFFHRKALQLPSSQQLQQQHMRQSTLSNDKKRKQDPTVTSMDVEKASSTAPSSSSSSSNGASKAEDDRKRSHKRSKTDSSSSQSKSSSMSQPASPFASLYVPFPLSVILEVSAKECSQKVPGAVDLLFPVRMKFEYLPELEVITVTLLAPTISKALTSEEKDQLLCFLFPGDDGLVSPNPTNALIHSSSGERFVFKETHAGRPFVWAQLVAGLSYFQPLTLDGVPSYAKSYQPASQLNWSLNQQPRLDHVLARLRQKVSNRMCLLYQLEYLNKKLQIPVEALVEINSIRALAFSPKFIFTAFNEVEADDWSATDYIPPWNKEFKTKSTTAKAGSVIGSNMNGHNTRQQVASSHAAETSRKPFHSIRSADDEIGMADPDDLVNEEPLTAVANFHSSGGDTTSFSSASRFNRYFKMSFQRGEVELDALIEISPEYPQCAPRFKLQFTKPPASISDKVTRLISDSVKAAFVQQVPPESSQPVYNSHLKMIESELIDFTDALTSEDSAHFLLSAQIRRLQICLDILVDSESSLEVSGSVEHGYSQFLRRHRGRDRAKPFSFNPQTSLFEQR